MTLKEKFKEILIAFWTNEWESECEKVADEFAIGFANWLLITDTANNAEKWFGYSNKDILEIYKKEKGL